MTRLVWRQMALADRKAIMDYIAQDNPGAAVDLDDDFEARAELAKEHPKLYRAGRMKGTREEASDIPELAERFFEKATVQWPPHKRRLTIRLDAGI